MFCETDLLVLHFLRNAKNMKYCFRHEFQDFSVCPGLSPRTPARIGLVRPLFIFSSCWLGGKKRVEVVFDLPLYLDFIKSDLVIVLSFPNSWNILHRNSNYGSSFYSLNPYFDQEAPFSYKLSDHVPLSQLAVGH